MAEEWGNVAKYEAAPVREIPVEEVTGLGGVAKATATLGSLRLVLAPARVPPLGRLILLVAVLSLSLATMGQILETRGFVPAVSPALTRQRVETAVKGYLDTWDPRTDPLIILESGVQLKSSHVRGIEIDGKRYYYRTVFGYSGDPVSRGETSDYQIFIVLDAGTHFEAEVYQLTR